MRRTPKLLALATTAVLLTLSAAACTPDNTPAAAATPTPTPTPVAATSAPVAPKSPVTSTSAYQTPEEMYLLDNKIYSAGRVQAVPCKLPQLALRTQKQVLQYSTAVVDCLARAWKPLIDRADATYLPVTVYTVTQKSRTACGLFSGSYDAFYCAENTGVYLDWRRIADIGGRDRVWAAVYLQFVMAHEFGHHVQQLVWISTYYDDRWEHTTGAAQLEQMRRHELQASCFASAFLAANQKTLGLYGERLQDYREAAYSGDDDAPKSTPDHGSRKSSTAWAKAAFKAKSPSACNTWVVPAKRVS